MVSLEHIQFTGAESAPSKSSGSAWNSYFSRARDTPVPRQKPAPFLIEPDLVHILNRAGVDANAYRPHALLRRVPACLRKLRVNSLSEARELLERRVELLPAAATALLLGVSSFFRDRPVFDVLEKVTLPALLKDRKGLRVLSAGCSDGQELYSVAMLLDKLGALNGSFLLGVDCRSQAIQNARAGLYAPACLKEVAPAWRKYFDCSAGSVRVEARLRSASNWRQDDITELADPTLWDLILFRNVAIYLGENQGRMVWINLTSKLACDGVLVTGKAEAPPRDLDLSREDLCIYTKQKPAGWKGSLTSNNRVHSASWGAGLNYTRELTAL